MDHLPSPILAAQRPPRALCGTARGVQPSQALSTPSVLSLSLPLPLTLLQRERRDPSPLGEQPHRCGGSSTQPALR